MGEYDIGISCSHWGAFPVTLHVLSRNKFQDLLDFA